MEVISVISLVYQTIKLIKDIHDQIQDNKSGEYY